MSRCPRKPLPGPRHFLRGRGGKRAPLSSLLLLAACLCLALAEPPRGRGPSRWSRRSPRPAPASPCPARTPPQGTGAAPIEVPIGYLKQEVKTLIPLSRLHVEPEDYGIAGAELALEDNNTTGRFTKQHFTLDVERVPIGGDAVAALQKLVDSGHRFVLVDAPAATLLALSDAVKGKDVLLFNVRAEDEELRQEQCRANVLHTAPDRDMLADALAQYLVWKKWQRWFVVKGPFPEDLAYLEAIRRAAKRFGGTIVEEREYKETPGARRTDTGEQLIQQQMPAFTQGAPDYDVLIVADEKEVFGPYLPYRTSDPRPVAGTTGLTAMSWHPAHEQWGATQMQNRFQRFAKRFMWPVDYQAWIAVRAVGEGATRVHSGDESAGQRLYPRQGFRSCRLQGTEGDLPQMGRAAPRADHRHRPRSAGVDVPASGLPAQGRRGRHARDRRAGNEMQAQMRRISLARAEAERKERRMPRTPLFAIAIAVTAGMACLPRHAAAYTVYVSNEKGNSITVIDSATLEVKRTIPVGQRPRGIMLTRDGKQLLICASDDDTIQILDVATGNNRRHAALRAPTPSSSTFIPPAARSTSPMRTTR